MRKRILSMILALMLFSTLLIPVSAHAAIDFNRLGSVSVSMTYHGEAILGGTLTLYRVADVIFDNGDYSFAYTSDFEECTIPVTEISSARLARALAKIARNTDLEGTTHSLGRNGKTVFEDLEVGLYLLVQNKAAPGFSRVNPFLVAVPFNENDHYIYDVDTAPKNIPGPEVDEPDEPYEPDAEEPSKPSKPEQPEKPAEPSLPQTGQMNWPVPVLAVVGMSLIAAGLVLRRSGKNESNEA